MRLETLADSATFRSYLFFWSGQLTSLLGSSIAQFVIVWWITLETESAVYLSVATFAGFAPTVVLSPLAGVYVDRWNRKALIGVVDLLQALATVSLIVMFWFNIVSIWHVIAISIVRGVFQAFHFPAVSALVPLMVPSDKLSRMNGLNYLFSGVVNFVGPLAAALLLEIWRIHQILWIDAATFIVALVPLLVISIPSVTKKQEGKDIPSFRRDFIEGLAFIKSKEGLLALIVSATVLNFLMMPLPTLSAYYVRVDHLGEAKDLAFIGASFQGGMLAGGLLMSVIKGFKKKMVVTAVFLYIGSLAYGIVALTPQGMFWLMAAGVLVIGFSLPIINVSIQTIMQTVIPVNIFGRVNSVISSLANVASPLGMVLSGPLAETVGTANLYKSCSILEALSLTLLWLFTDIRQVEKMAVQPPSSDS